MRRSLLWAVLALILVGLYSPFGVAQDEPSPFEGKKVMPLVSDADQKLKAARKLIQTERYQEAADLLESLYEADPENPLLQNLLMTCYDQLRRDDRTEEIVRRFLERDPGSFGYRMRLAELLARQGRRDEALEEYRQAASLIPPADLGRHLLVVQSLMDSGMDDDALAYVDQARRALGDSLAFALERGSLLERHRRYSEATREYLPLLQQDTTPEAGVAEKRLMALLEYGESSTLVEPALAAIAGNSAAGLRTMRLLADYYLKAGRFREAFAYTLRQDSLQERSGLPLMVYIRSCRERRAWGEVAAAATYVLERYPGSKFETDASLECAAALAQLGRAHEAIEVYRRLHDNSPHPQLKTDALFGIGAVYYNNLGDIDSALVYFDSIVSAYPRGRNYLGARLIRPRCYLRQGRLDKARSDLTDVASGRLYDEAREEVGYFLGLTDFFARRYDSAQALFRKLTVDFPKGLYVNDALEMLMLFGRASGSTAVLDDYSSAALMKFRGRLDSARQMLVAVTENDDKALADVALFELAELELQRSDTTAALDVIDRLDQRYAESYYRPLALRMKADLLASRPTGLDEARRIYRYLLENCSEYPFAGEVRERLRRLETPPPVG